MDVKSVAMNKVSLRDETARTKSLQKSTEMMKRKESTKYAMSDNDALCGIEIYEVLGNVQDEGEGTHQVQNQSENYKKLGECEESVGGNEVLLRRTTQKETPKNNKNDDFVGLAYLVEGQNDRNEKELVLLRKNSHDDILLATGTVQNTTALQNPGEGMESNSAVTTVRTTVILNTELDVRSMQDCELLLGGGDETMSSLYSSVKTMNDISSKAIEKERLIDEVNPINEILNEDMAGEKINMEIDESHGNGNGTNNGIFIREENKENTGNDDGQDSTSKVGQEESMENCNGDDELVASSGSSWENEVQLASEFYPSVDNNDEDEDEDEDEGPNIIGELKVNEAGSVEFTKRNLGEMIGEDGTCIETQTGNMLEESEEEDKGMVEDTEIESFLQANGINEGGKRKRISNGEGTRGLNIKKRKTEKCRKNELNSRSGSKGKCITDKSTRKESAKSTSDICDQTTLEETIDRVASGHLSLPFLESLRGSIKALSRADLEELIVQKLCEVITERSTVGHLRKRAEALERSQERWKEKVLSLTKQIKEMDMVMKKYLSEVRRHHTERSFQMVAPLRVTRSVGLQVSFTSASSKVTKIVPGQNHSGNRDKRHGLDKGVKQHLQRAVFITQKPKKSISLLPTTPVKKSLVIGQKNKVNPKSGVNLTFQARLFSETHLAAKQALHLQRSNQSKVAEITEEAHNANLIDLTDDDDRQIQENGQIPPQQSVTVGPSNQIKVVNHIQPAQNTASTVPCLPNPTTSAGSSNATQNRQMLPPSSSAQQTPRPILPSIPPLLYKGSTLVQPGSQQQPVPNQNRALIPVSMKHPAPLPQPPLNQVQKANWKLLPPRPALKISKGPKGIVLSWNMTLNPEHETIASYQLFAYQENSCPPTISLWRKVGDVKALPLPMACTLTQFISGHKYFFAVRAIDIHSRIGPFSFPGSIVLIK